MAWSYLYLDEQHIWFDLPLDELLETTPLPENAVLDVRRLAGVDKWTVEVGGVEAFTCLIYYDRTPVLASPGGWLELPPRTAALEDSETAAAFRGHGIAPAAWKAIADRLGASGRFDRLITKVSVSNVASRKAVAKVGFRDAAVQRVRRVVGRKSVHVDVLTPFGDVLRERLV
jgi:hypothetical protein